jgi:uncharacterized protein (DUF849 family)
VETAERIHNAAMAMVAAGAGGSRPIASPGREPVLVKACLNGSRRREDHAAVPISPAEVARAASASVAAGAGALHVHPRDPSGAETLDPDHCAATIEAVRAACPGIPLGLTTGAWIAGGPERERLVAAWPIAPDFVSVNFIEDGAAELARLALARGIGVEAGLASLADVEVLRQSGLAPEMVRLLIEVDPDDADEAAALAAAIDAALADVAPERARRLHHGVGRATWRVIEAAIARGRDVRVGLEDTLWLPDGAVARDNAELVAAAAALVRRAGASPAG